MILPALSVRQPWASMIASGRKTIETRVWGVSWRGPLAIVSSKFPDRNFEEAQTSGLPYGRALCVVDVVASRPMTEADEQAACCEVYPRAMAWVFGDLWPLVHFPVTGNLGIYAIEIFPAHVMGGQVAYDAIAARTNDDWRPKQ